MSEQRRRRRRRRKGHSGHNASSSENTPISSPDSAQKRRNKKNKKMQQELETLREMKAKMDEDLQKATEAAEKERFKEEVVNSMKEKLEAEDRQMQITKEQQEVIKALQKEPGCCKCCACGGKGFR